MNCTGSDMIVCAISRVAAYTATARIEDSGPTLAPAIVGTPVRKRNGFSVATIVTALRSARPSTGIARPLPLRLVLGALA